MTKMTRCIFISPYLADKDSGGGLVSRTNLSCVKAVVPETEAYALATSESQPGIMNVGAPRGKISTAVHNIFGLVGRLRFSSLFKILLIIYKKKPEILFLDSSSLGIIAFFSKIISPSTRVISFFHNIEFEFQKERVKQDGFFYAITAAAEYLNEKLSTHYSNLLLMLTQEDSKKSKLLYGRHADYITPVVFDTNYIPDLPKRNDKKIFLFVGSNFFANRQAVDFIIHKISPLIKDEAGIEIWIAGSGFSASGWGKELPANVKMFGRVEDLVPLYQAACAIITPIFSGAGMKVKVAESLMHGRPVIGTALSLRGYLESTPLPHLIQAETAQEFKHAMEAFSTNQEDLTKSSYQDFERRFSKQSGLTRMKSILKEKIDA